jgi:hypothetical protein
MDTTVLNTSANYFESKITKLGTIIETSYTKVINTLRSTKNWKHSFNLFSSTIPTWKAYCQYCFYSIHFIKGSFFCILSTWVHINRKLLTCCLICSTQYSKYLCFFNDKSITKHTTCLMLKTIIELDTRFFVFQNQK